MHDVSESLVPFISEDEIQRMIKVLAYKISADYEPIITQDQKLIFVVILKGALFFAADLVRHLTLPVEVDFVRLSSYGSGTKSSGNVKILKDIDSDTKDQHVLLIDEIVDSGHTLHFLKDRLSTTDPASLKICALLSKPSRREITVPVDYVGRKVEDKFLVGYGLDYKEKFRNLPGIYVMS